MSSGNPVAMDDVRGPAAFEQLTKVEQEATEIYLNQPLFLPGLLQVASYAAVMIGELRGLSAGEPELTERVNARVQRGEAFTKRLQGAAPPHLWAVIDEAVVRRLVGGPAVMRDQLDHLLSMSKLDTVHLGIVPFGFGAYRGLGGSFELHLADGPAWLFLEGEFGDQFTAADELQARRYRETVKALHDSAVSGPKAQAMLEAIIAGL